MTQWNFGDEELWDLAESEFLDLVDFIKNFQREVGVEPFYLDVLFYRRVGGLIVGITEYANLSHEYKRFPYKFLASRLRQEFPGRKDFSCHNLKNMMHFAQAYPSYEFIENFAARLPWSHNLTIIRYVDEFIQREWYIEQAIANKWICKTLRRQINNNLYDRQEKALTNFDGVLPKLVAEKAHKALKDPLVFDLNLPEIYKESDLENALISSLKDFLIELGFGFAYMGNQVPIPVGEKTYLLDLLFFHVYLNCFVVIDLKVVEFTPEFAGKMNFYISAIDAQLRAPEHNPTIGMILCKSRNETVVKLALRGHNSPISVSTYQLSGNLPAQMESYLPSTKQLEMEVEAATAKFVDLSY